MINNRSILFQSQRVFKKKKDPSKLLIRLKKFGISILWFTFSISGEDLSLPIHRSWAIFARYGDVHSSSRWLTLHQSSQARPSPIPTRAAVGRHVLAICQPSISYHCQPVMQENERRCRGGRKEGLTCGPHLSGYYIWEGERLPIFFFLTEERLPVGSFVGDPILYYRESCVT